ncbi:TPA: hypothetical protein MAD82_003636 [Klebsiella pneumoniae]|uniref:hypothetical protein n=1 Tax=Klebsiella TaxID=570 RepID=UPI000E2D7EC5|nr:MULTISPECIES: hypothetical protein [Klebsiella]HCI6153403.1 hypothetical protein [Klebsiella variicola subsp. variicola]EKX9392380.1 hypothetical protein [Klebsiella pneumoniae]MDL4444822.1 hypothetical protein [Klebsiella michiganensis]MDL4486285.1 hypothetical protein [Klebsiella michiganensis]MDL4661123.1 hypothetical protein [Klebsiella michiganensis]
MSNPPTIITIRIKNDEKEYKKLATDCKAVAKEINVQEAYQKLDREITVIPLGCNFRLDNIDTCVKVQVFCSAKIAKVINNNIEQKLEALGYKIEQ